MAVNTQKSNAYNQIKRKILFGHLQAGEVIEPKQLVEELNFGSITPIREALLQLQSEGLVVIRPRKGMFVSEISISEIVSNYQVREVLEPPFLLMSAPNIKKEFITKYRELFKSLENQEDGFDYELYLDTDMRFHLELLEPCGNETLNGILRGIYEQNVRYRMLSIKRRRVEAMISEHYDILDAIDREEYEGASELLRRHTINSKTALLSAMNII